MKEMILAYQGEMTLKGLNRNKFEARLAKSIRYRLEDLGEEEIALTGIEDCFARQNVVFVEWPGYIKDWLPEDTIRMQIERGADDNERLLEFVYDPVKQGWLNEAFSY